MLCNAQKKNREEILVTISGEFLIAIPIDKPECREEVQCASSETLSSVEDRSGCEVNEEKIYITFQKKKN